MTDADFPGFHRLLTDVAGLMGKPAPDARQAALFFRSVSYWPATMVHAAIEAHVRDPQRGRFPPLPADVIAQIAAAAAADGRPAPDEAWSLARRAADEAVTVIWTAETAEAWGIALPVFSAGDEVGARMAFKAAYSRLLDEARASHAKAVWTPSIGHDVRMRDEALSKAVADGKLSDKYLPAPSAGMGLIELAKSKTVPKAIREKLLEVRRLIANKGPAGSGESYVASADALEKVKTAEAKERAQRMADEYMARAAA